MPVPDRVDLPAGPGGPSLFQFWRWIYRPVETLEDCSRRFGDWFTVRFPRGIDVVFTSSAEAAKDVFSGDPDKLFAGEGNVIFKPLLGRHSLLVLDGHAHRRARRLMMPPFHGERMRAYGETIAGLVDRHAARWPRARVMRAHPAMQALTLDVILATIFGMTSGERLDRLRATLIRLLDSNQSAAALFLSALLLNDDGRPPLATIQETLGPLTRWGRFVRLRNGIDQLLYAEIAERRRAGARGRADVLSLLIDATDQDGEALSDEELRDELITLLVAGHETSATALSWALGHLASQTRVLERLRSDIRAVGAGGAASANAVMTLPYLDAAINETLRLHPVAPFVWRILKAPLRLGGRTLPAGAAIAPSIYLIHRSPRIWRGPERFEPERFLDARPAPWEFLPFGGGGRRCLGMAFATYEIKLILASILRSFSLESAPGYGARIVRRGVTFAPSEGMPVILREE